jgi:paraquat-inducible protein A
MGRRTGSTSPGFVGAAAPAPLRLSRLRVEAGNSQDGQATAPERVNEASRAVSERRHFLNSALRAPNAAMTIECPDCGAVQDIPPLADAVRADCRRCGRTLESRVGRGLEKAAFCSTACLVLLCAANTGPLFTVSMLGVEKSSFMGSGVLALWNRQWVIQGVLVGLAAVLVPLVWSALLAGVLTALRLGRRSGRLGQAYRWALWLDDWAMPDVFLVACLIGYGRLVVNLEVRTGWGAWCLLAAALLSMVSRGVLDRQGTWELIKAAPSHGPGQELVCCDACLFTLPQQHEGEPCPRCGLRLKARKSDSVSRTAALTIAGFLLYWPANVFPMSTANQFGTPKPHTIIGGIEDLFGAGLPVLGVLIFCTSIAIPVLKIAGLAWFLASIRMGSGRRLALKTKLNRLIHRIGRWSAVDPFTVAVFMPLMQFRPFVSVRSDWGATAFIGVVVLTLMASRSFDSRLLWDAGERCDR